MGNFTAEFAVDIPRLGADGTPPGTCQVSVVCSQTFRTNAPYLRTPNISLKHDFSPNGGNKEGPGRPCGLREGSRRPAVLLEGCGRFQRRVGWPGTLGSLKYAQKDVKYTLKGSYTGRRLSVTENNGNRVINEATMVTPSKLKGGIFTLRCSETAQNDR